MNWKEIDIGKSLKIVLMVCCCSLAAMAQTKTDTFKTLNDTHFEVGDQIISPGIYFYLNGGHDLVPQCRDSVKLVADFLVRHSDLQIEIGYHTDIRDSEDHNMRFSQFRANQIKRLLVEDHGISAERVVAEGYGESEPIFDWEDINKVSPEKQEELHEKNRRIIITIIKT